MKAKFQDFQKWRNIPLTENAVRVLTTYGFIWSHRSPSCSPSPVRKKKKKSSKKRKRH